MANPFRSFKAVQPKVSVTVFAEQCAQYVAASTNAMRDCLDCAAVLANTLRAGETFTPDQHAELDTRLQQIRAAVDAQEAEARVLLSRLSSVR